MPNLRNGVLRVSSAALAAMILSSQGFAKTVDPAEFVAKLVGKKQQAQLSALSKVTDEALLAEIAKSGALAPGVAQAALNRLTEPARIADVARSAASYDVQEKAIERTSDQAVLIEILMEPQKGFVHKPFDAAAARLTEASAVEVATKAPSESQRARAVRRLSDQRLIAEVAANDASDPVARAATETLTSQDALAALAVNGRSAYIRIAAINKVSDQALLGRIARGTGSIAERKAALLRLTDQGTLADIALSRSADAEQRADAVRRIEDKTLLVRIAKGESRLDVLQAALDQLKDEAQLLDIARTARYALTRRLVIARLDSHWRKELSMASPTAKIGRSQTEIGVTLTNAGRDLAYSGLRYWFPGMQSVDPDKAPSLYGVIEPGTTKTLTEYLSGDWSSFLRGQSALALVAAEPILPGGAMDLTVGGTAAPVAGANHPPAIHEQASWRQTRTSNLVGDITGMTSEILITAIDPDGDALTYDWSVSNGTVEASRPIAKWLRIVRAGRVEGGRITVTVEDGRGGRATRSFVSE
jgi:hypothetical protein